MQRHGSPSLRENLKLPSSMIVVRPDTCDTPIRVRRAVKDAAHSSLRGYRPPVRRPRTYKRPASYCRSREFQRSGKCASARSPKPRSLRGSGIELPAGRRIDQPRSEPVRHSLMAQALGQAWPAVAKGTGSLSAREQGRARLQPLGGWFRFQRDMRRRTRAWSDQRPGLRPCSPRILHRTDLRS